MKLHIPLFTLSLVLAANSPLAAQTIALLGSVHNANGAGIAGASVFVQRSINASGATTGDKEVGPVATSSSGTFSFYNLPSGTYVVRIAIAGSNVWIGRTHVPGQLPPIVLR